MHTSFPKGTTIFVIFKDGSSTTGKFADHKSGKVLLEDGRVLDIKTVRAMSNRRLKETQKPKSGKTIKFRI